MNERIQKLAEQQAGAILMDLVMPDSGMPERVKWNVGITSEHLEKFAQLIVEECTTVIDRNLFQNIGWNTSRAVRQHFGIDQVDE